MRLRAPPCASRVAYNTKINSSKRSRQYSKGLGHPDGS
jgi:hypothetical protein